MGVSGSRWWVAVVPGPQISTMEVTFQTHIIDSTIFQTNSFDFLSEFAQLISCSTCSAYSGELSRESGKMSQQNERTNLFHLNKLFMIQIFFLNRATALLTELPDRHDMIACISFAYKFQKMDADNKKSINHFHLCLLLA